MCLVTRLAESKDTKSLAKLELVTEQKPLGVLVTDNLNWNKNVAHVCKNNKGTSDNSLMDPCKNVCPLRSRDICFVPLFR